MAVTGQYTGSAHRVSAGRGKREREGRGLALTHPRTPLPTTPRLPVVRMLRQHRLRRGLLPVVRGRAGEKQGRLVQPGPHEPPQQRGRQEGNVALLPSPPPPGWGRARRGPRNTLPATRYSASVAQALTSTRHLLSASGVQGGGTEKQTGAGVTGRVALPTQHPYPCVVLRVSILLSHTSTPLIGSRARTGTFCVTVKITCLTMVPSAFSVSALQGSRADSVQPCSSPSCHLSVS